ncbi:prolyl oligopeptidase-like protein [Halenospora varia]|nr:prolyl oligopeptidase-like protein [Halenospora varia]
MLIITLIVLDLFYFLSYVLAIPSVTLPNHNITYQGTTSASKAIEHFLNIRYAHSTSGHRRFAPPEPFSPPHNSILNVTLPGPACPQLKSGMPPFFSAIQEISEDCLNLRIERPAGITSENGDKVPVVVWIHGGGVVKGNAYDEHFDPSNLLALSISDGKPIIFVSIQYRLSIFGFARTKLLKERKSLNAGMRDQRMALEWVKENIVHFGGDPDRITAVGLSAGGTFIGLQMLAYGGERGVPFSRAWMMSGPPGTALGMSSEITEFHTSVVAEKIGCSGMEEQMLECLRGIPTESLLEKAMEYSVENFPPAGLFTFIPSVDGDFVPDVQSKLIKEGSFVKGIPMIFGWTQDDSAMNVGPGHFIQTEEDMIPPLKKFASALNTTQMNNLFAHYPAYAFEEELSNYNLRKSSADPEISVHYFRLSRILRDMLFTCSSIEFGFQMAKKSQATGEHTFDNVYLYALNQSVLTSLWKSAGMPYVGVSHGSDTNYIFNGVFPEGEMDEENKKLAVEMSRNLINFAYYGKPEDEGEKKIDKEGWPIAFDGGPKYHLRGNKEPMPDVVNLQVIGGPYVGTTEVTHLDYERWQDESEDEVWWEREKWEQQTFQMDEMESAEASERKRIIRQEKLLRRCKFINSLAGTLGV